MEDFKDAELMLDITEHTLVPQHTVSGEGAKASAAVYLGAGGVVYSYSGALGCGVSDWVMHHIRVTRYDDTKL